MDHRNPDTWTPEFAREIERVREYVATLHAELPRWGLVVWTAGNVSQRVRGAAEDGSQDLLVIKPSGVSYDDLSPEAMVGRDARAAVKAAAMVEEVAKTVHVARAGGPLVPIEQHHIDSLYDRYQNVYGQH